MRTFVALLVLVVAVSAELAPFLHANSPTVVPNSYIVVLKDGLTVQTRDAHVLALKTHMIAAADGVSEVGHLYNIGPMIGFSAKMSEAVLKAQLAHPFVKYIEADQVVSINYEQDVRAPLDLVTQTGATWGLNRVAERDLLLDGLYRYDNLANGQGVDVYVIDTGVLVSHVDFGGRATAAFNAVAGESITDLNGHGTHCAGTIGGAIYGVAKSANIIAVKVLNAGGQGTTAGVVAGVNYVTNNRTSGNPAVASMSLGGGASQALDDSVIASIAAGVVYAIAAGNSNANACNYSPARVSTAVTVGATDRTDARATYSNIGTCVAIFAPGTSITSDWIGTNNNATSTISGTSMATPHVAGVLAIQLSINPTLTPAQNGAALILASSIGYVTSPGAGSPNYLLYSSPPQ